ncbi:hypothetical protein [Cryobacterium sp. CG_9.6]|nr:hypothetical protein [Cryobacterium sp. CG_9.6]MDH6238418.1 hypothetical protein [Cryobacterium sp. CG_9.6]
MIPADEPLRAYDPDAAGSGNIDDRLEVQAHFVPVEGDQEFRLT